MVPPSTDFDGGSTPAMKRRKVRKGTQSCWECKRRKIRCTFAEPSESVCDGCKSRRVQCIGQQFVEASSESHPTVDALDRMEAMIEKIAMRTTSDRRLLGCQGVNTSSKAPVSPLMEPLFDLGLPLTPITKVGSFCYSGSFPSRYTRTKQK